MRLLILMVLVTLADGCTLDRIEHDSSQVLGATRLAHELSIDRSSRWRIDDPGLLMLAAEYDPNDSRQVALLNAAFDGVNRVYPQTVLDPAPAMMGAPIEIISEPVALLIHVDIPSAAAAGVTRFPVALVDVRTGYVIDRATLTLRSSWWGGSDDSAEVAQLFHDYAAQLRPSQ
jgi:hypothetical protein